MIDKNTVVQELTNVLNNLGGALQASKKGNYKAPGTVYRKLDELYNEVESLQSEIEAGEYD